MDAGLAETAVTLPERSAAEPPLELKVDRYIDDVVERMKAHLANIDGAQATMIDETKEAALLLVEARDKYPNREQDICKRVGIKFRGSRYYELIAIGAGRKTVAQIRDANAKRKRAEEERKALPKPTAKLPPGSLPSCPTKLSPEDAGVREITDPRPAPKSTAVPEMLSAQKAMSLIYPILEKVETRRWGLSPSKFLTTPSAVATRRQRRPRHRGRIGMSKQIRRRYP